MNNSYQNEADAPLEDNSVTIRDRDTMNQERISIDKIIEALSNKI